MGRPCIRSRRPAADRSYLLAMMIHILVVVAMSHHYPCHGMVTVIVSEGSLRNIKVAQTLAKTPSGGSSLPGFYNPKRMVGRDFTVLSVAQWLVKQHDDRQYLLSSPPPTLLFPDTKNHHNGSTTRPPLRLLDAMSASGMQGLRVAFESSILAQRAIITTRKGENGMDDDSSLSIIGLPDLQVVLNDVDQDAADLAEENSQMLLSDWETQHNSSIPNNNVTVTRRVAQALLYEQNFDVCVLDPFGSCIPFLDAALARAPHLGLLEICATDVNVLYGSRPKIVARHYNAKLQPQRPPCYRERGVRLLIAAVAQAAGRQGRGIEPVLSVSTEHYVLLSVRVIRGARGADDTAKQVKAVRICRTCSAAGITEAPKCGCKPIAGAGSDASEEGPIWIGELYDLEAAQGMARMANLGGDGNNDMGSIISDETRALLTTLQEEASVKDAMFYRRPGVAGARAPKLNCVIEELQDRGYAAARTHFDTRALKSNAPVDEFDSAVKAVLARD